MFSYNFNNFNATAINHIFITGATTETVALSGGFIQFNSGSSTTTAQGVGIISNRSFPIDVGSTLEVNFTAKTVNGTATNKIVEIGLGNWNTGTAGQGAALNDGVVFRWTSTGGFQGILCHNANEQSVNLNSNVPLADSIAYRFKIIITEGSAEFWINGTRYGRLSFSTTQPGSLRLAALQAMVRHSNVGTASAATQILVGDVTVYSTRGNVSLPYAHRAVLSGRGAYQLQSGIGTTSGSTANYANSAAPASASLSNTAAGYTTLGGQWQFAAVGGAETDYALFAYQNPAVPLAAGAANEGRNLLITGIRISSMNTGAAVATTASTLQWSLAVGSTAVSLATTDSAAARSPRRVTLGLQSFPIGAAISATPTPGDIDCRFTAPLLCEPGNFVHVILKCSVGTATGSQIIRGTCQIEGYWE